MTSYAPSKRGRILDEKWHKKRRKCQKTAENGPKIEENAENHAKTIKKWSKQGGKPVLQRVL
ncbi:MAG: hypothetical protein PHP44_08915 [Kiritimatiellae bacterium]|nr:hypothetical protein [Kiritimatiellia bacterium]